MLRRSLVLGFVTGATLLAWTSAEACGDKFLVIGRGTKRVAKARHPATILLYIRTGSQLAQAAREIGLEATLKQAGHRVETLQEASLRASAASGFDFVVTDLADAAGVADQLRSLERKPAVVPVAYKSSKDQLAGAEKQFGLVIPAPGKSLAYLAALDRSMGLRLTAVASS